MTNSIEQITISEQLKLCHQMQKDIFHQELNLLGMKIPDGYDDFSIYMQIRDSEAMVGTYRVVLPNASVGLPIEETGFDLQQFQPQKVCEMSRLVILKEQRGKIPFKKIIVSACNIAKEHGASILVVALLPCNVTLFKRNGFSQVGSPLSDPSVDSGNTEEAVIVPMQIQI